MYTMHYNENSLDIQVYFVWGLDKESYQTENNKMRLNKLHIY